MIQAGPWLLCARSFAVNYDVPTRSVKAAFTEPTLLLPAATLPEGANWAYELKRDGRALAIKTEDRVSLRSSNNKDVNPRYPAVCEGARVAA